MKVLIVDMTHGGTTIASEFSKKQNCDVFAWDIYNTLSDENRSWLEAQQIELVDDSFYKNFYNEKLRGSHDNNEIVVAPVHCNLPYMADMTHHQAVGYLMKDCIKVPIIEITGVKGKTTTAAMLKEIYHDQNPLILSSLGVEIVKDGKEIILKKDISITPASIITAWRLAEEFYKEFYNLEKPKKDLISSNVGICIFESSLGGTSLADVGAITNIAEDYPIAQGSSNASKAKSQMFESKMVVCDYGSYKSIYSKYENFQSFLLKQNINTYSIGEKSNVKSFNIDYDLYKTTFQIEVNDLQTVDGRCINTSFEASTFAPAQYHLENTLCSITASLTMGTSIGSITKGLENFTGLPGRTSLRNVMLAKTSPYNNMQNKSSFHNNNSFSNTNKVRVIEEINPGINVTAIKRAVTMIKNYENPAIVLGGNYGVTCEEIDEESLIRFLGKISDGICIILTGKLGRSLLDKMDGELIYHNQIDQAVNLAIKGGANNILLVYRSNFADLTRR